MDVVGLDAGLVAIHPHLTAWARAVRNTAWMRLTEFGAGGLPPLPPGGEARSARHRDRRPLEFTPVVPQLDGFTDRSGVGGEPPVIDPATAPAHHDPTATIRRLGGQSRLGNTVASISGLTSSELVSHGVPGRTRTCAHVSGIAQERCRGVCSCSFGLVRAHVVGPPVV